MIEAQNPTISESGFSFSVSYSEFSVSVVCPIWIYQNKTVASEHRWRFGLQETTAMKQGIKNFVEEKNRWIEAPETGLWARSRDESQRSGSKQIKTRELVFF